MIQILNVFGLSGPSGDRLPSKEVIESECQGTAAEAVKQLLKNPDVLKWDWWQMSSHVGKLLASDEDGVVLCVLVVTL
jgi:hypothetical protein